MGVPISEVGYTSATAGRGDHEVNKGHVVAFGGKTIVWNSLLHKTYNILVKITKFVALT
jgi:hypothetical protein